MTRPGIAPEILSSSTRSAGNLAPCSRERSMLKMELSASQALRKRAEQGLEQHSWLGLRNVDDRSVTRARCERYLGGDRRPRHRSGTGIGSRWRLPSM